MRTFFLTVFLFFWGFNAIAQSKSEMHFQAKIENRNSDSIYIKDLDYKTIKIITLNSEGIFKDVVTFDDGLYLLFDGTEYFKIYLKNGYDLQLTMNTHNIRETLFFSGVGADINNYLVKELFIEIDYNYGVLSSAKSKKITKLINDKQKAETNRLIAHREFDPAFLSIQTSVFKSNAEELKKYYGELREMN